MERSNLLTCQRARKVERLISAPLWLILCVALFIAAAVSSTQPDHQPQAKFRALEEKEEKFIDDALKMLSLTRSDPGFKKDYVDDAFRLQKVQDSLHKPLELPGECDRIDEAWKGVKTLSDALKIQAEQLGKWWAIEAGADAKAGPHASEIDRIVRRSPQPIQPVVKRLLSAVYESQALMDKAFERLTADEKKYLVKEFIPALLYKPDTDKDDFQTEAEKVKLNLVPPEEKSPGNVRRHIVIGAERKPVFDLTLKIQFGFLHRAGRVVTSAVDDAIAMLKATDLRGVKATPVSNQAVTGDAIFYADTPFGPVVIGGSGENVYRQDAALIVDIGGDDRYLNRAGGAVGMNKPTASVTIDLSGDDWYLARAGRKFSQGSGLFGIGVLVDMDGSDRYEAQHFAQGCGLFGIGVVWDGGAGGDWFTADHFCQGAGGWGIGILYDEAGDTHYDSRTLSQGLGYTLGTGILVDNKGDDFYNAEGTPVDYGPDRPGIRPYSLSQGFGMGQRPVASGGIGILIDREGSDRYLGYYYAQGCCYWYGLGILIDDGGNDDYGAQVYAQGCGIHLATGVLIDRGGNDYYRCGGGGNAQGAAHDYAVGVLVDKEGSDVYVGYGNNQGSAITNAFSLFVDSGGDDVYKTVAKGGQGFGGAARNAISIGLFLDLGGNDYYSEQHLNVGCGTANNSKWVKGEKGAGIDTE